MSAPSPTVQDGDAYITSPGAGGDPLALSLEKVRIHAGRMESAMVRSSLEGSYFDRKCLQAYSGEMKVMSSHLETTPRCDGCQCHSLITYMQEQNDKRLVLKAASDMLLELSSTQNPKSYSSLYAEVFTHLQQLSVRCLCLLAFVSS
jgi:hypothetical protein